MDKSPEKPHNENARLMQEAADGNKEAFMCLHERLAPLMMQFFVKWGVNLDSAEDLVQEVFIRLWQRRKSYRLGSSLEAYLYSIARNTLYDEICKSHKIDRKGLKRRQVSDEGKYSGLSQPEAKLYIKELTEAFEKKKTKLTPKQMQELDAFQCQDIDFQKVTGDDGCSNEARKKRLKRGRKRLIELLAKFFTDKNG